MKTYLPTRRSRARAIAILLVSALFFVAAQLSQTTQAAGPFTVNSLADTPDAAPGNGICADAGGACTLRAAINEADAVFGEDTINFSVTGTINLTGPLPFISSMFINGPGSGLLTIRRNTGGDYRIFTVGLVFNTISGLTISNGRTPDGVGDAIAQGGGGILHSSGLLRLRDVVITGNATGNGGNSNTTIGGWGGFGGGIFSSGTLEMTDCVISNNTTGNGGTGAQLGGSGGRGAGIYFAPGTLTMKNVTITNNHTGTGGPNSGTTGPGGGMWLGGDFFPVQNTTADLTNVTITNNTTADNGATGTDTGGGAGIYIFQGTVTLTNSNVNNNHTGNVNPATPAAAAGRGGGINNNGTLTIVNSLVSANTTGNGPAGGANTTGGGITNAGTLTVINSTVSGNSTGTGPSMGGGIFSSATLKLINCTVTKNFTPDDLGNGISGNQGAITLANTIIAGNGNSANDPDLSNPLFTPPTFVSQGHNLIGNADGFASSFTATGDQKGTGAAPLDPLLGLLANNGGPTFTHALLSNSPALDGGDNALAKDANNNTLLTDQRGSQRFADSTDPDAIATVDIGAFEFLGSFEDITNQTTKEDLPLTVTFGVGDGHPSATSVTASSNNQVLVPDANLVVSGTGNVRSLLITPVADLSGLATITVTVDLSGGGSIVDTFSLTVLPVNDMPTFTKGANQTVDEDSGPQTVNNWATGVSAGPNEGAQTLTFIVEPTSITFAELFSVAPAISASGALTYTPAPDRSGTATFIVNLKDDGGTANGGQDTLAPQQIFTITINEVNDPPSFTKGLDQTVAEDPGFQSIGTWATNISAGPNEAQILTFQVTNNTNPGLFSIPPFVGSAGQLSYMPAANASGFADITVVLNDGGLTTAGQTFRITVTPVNDAPVNHVPSFPATIQNTPLMFSTANFNAISVTDVDAGTDPIRVTLTGTHGTVSLSSTTGLTFVTGDGTDDVTMTFTGTVATINSRLNGLTFKPETGFVTGAEVASIQIISDDLGHNGDGGAKSTTTTLNIFVQSGAVLLTEEGTEHAIALDLVQLTRDPFSLTGPFNLSTDQRGRISLFVWRLGLLPSDTAANLSVVARDNEGRTYDLTVEALSAVPAVADVTQIGVRLPDTVIGAPRDLLVKVTLHGSSTNEAFIKIGAP